MRNKSHPFQNVAHSASFFDVTREKGYARRAGRAPSDTDRLILSLQDAQDACPWAARIVTDRIAIDQQVNGPYDWATEETTR